LALKQGQIKRVGIDVRYRIEDIEEQILATLRADPVLSRVTIETHAGQVNAGSFFPDPSESILQCLPFIFIQYQGRKWDTADSAKRMNIFEVRFRLYIGAQSLRDKQEQQRDAYSMLRSVYDDLHGKIPFSAPQKLSGSTSNGILSGTVINATTTEFNPQSPLMVSTGMDELILVNLSQLVVYQADFAIRLQG
jgi:hypothetical protein